MSEFRIRKLSTEDWETYRSVRLNSLKDSPDSFGSTYEREVAFSESDWKARLMQNSDNISISLIADVDEEPAGIASGVIWKTDKDVTHIYQMWVAPKSRGIGIARALLAHIVEWAKSQRCQELMLSVTTTNVEAVNLYHSTGFAPSGALENLREGSTLETQPMVRKVGSAA